MNLQRQRLSDMHIETLYNYCHAKKGVTSDFPFDEEVLAFRVMGKIFALTSVEQTPMRVNLKCDPERAIALREAHEAVQPGYHMNKQHWNTVEANLDVPDTLFLELVDHSYALVAQSLKKSQREALAAL